MAKNGLLYICRCWCDEHCVMSMEGYCDEELMFYIFKIDDIGHRNEEMIASAFAE